MDPLDDFLVDFGGKTRWEASIAHLLLYEVEVDLDSVEKRVAIQNAMRLVQPLGRSMSYSPAAVGISTRT